MKNISMQGKLGLLFLAFFLLVAISVGATLWGVEAQTMDAQVINLAGRQRMLAQQMTRLGLEIEKEGEDSHHLELQAAADTFEQTLQALKNGGTAPGLPGQLVAVPPPQNRQLLSQLDQVEATWAAFQIPFEATLNSTPGEAEFGAAVKSMEAISPELVAQSDNVVRMYEAAAGQKINRLRWVQTGFFLITLGLLAVGAWITRRSLLKPLKELGLAARRIGGGDLITPVKVSGPTEVSLLADTFETTRVQLLESREECLAWGNTLEEKVIQRTRELEGLYRVSRDISSRLDVREVLRSVTDQARDLLGAEVAFLCLVDEAAQTLNLHAASGSAEAVVQSCTSLQGVLPSQVLARECALLCGVEGCLGTCGIIAAPFRASQLAAPLRMDERVIGALCVGSPKTGAFPKESENLLTKLANSAAIAIENARLYAQAERLATLEERQRLAAEMHDGLAQTINYLRFSLDLANVHLDKGENERAIATLERMQQALNQAESEVRRAIASLQEHFPQYFTLQEQLASLAEELVTSSRRVKWESSVIVPLVLSDEETEQVLRVAREALLNACHHSQAQTIHLRLERIAGYARVSVEDDGLGFDPEDVPAEDGRQHFGLKIMRARAARIGGEVKLDSSPGKGTRVILTWPLEVETDFIAQQALSTSTR